MPDAPLFGEAVLVALMFGLAAVLTLYAARRLTGSWWIAVLVVALEVVIFPRTYSYPKILAYAAGFLVMWRYVERPSLSRLAQLAAVVVLAFGLRHDHGFYLGVGSLLTVVLVGMTVDGKTVLRTATTFSGAVLLMLSPYIMLRGDARRAVAARHARHRAAGGRELARPHDTGVRVRWQSAGLERGALAVLLVSSAAGVRGRRRVDALAPSSPIHSNARWWCP